MLDKFQMRNGFHRCHGARAKLTLLNTLEITISVYNDRINCYHLLTLSE